ncbi:uncharacterized protein LOC129741367 [Uranotaenia lowii]|uniref:uncharacterized protein LOC129741367 n=1 Tax=Uranotaenia lowii TaxID=190385 RepID=UPI0024783C03|nr:uncharacterized protein LOC129741367 [Uranotaenia lowii]
MDQKPSPPRDHSKTYGRVRFAKVRPSDEPHTGFRFPAATSRILAAKTSTPVNKPVVNEEKTPAAVALDLAGWIVDLDHTSLQRTTGSISIGEGQDIESVDTDEASMQNPSASKFPMVDIQPFLRLLKDVESSEQRTGAYPKPSQPEFEKWRLETENLRRVQSLQQQHAQENDIRRKREIELTNQLKLVEQQHRADVEKMQEKEAEYRRQIRRQEEERIEYRKQAEKALEERDRELSRLRFVEQELMSRLDQLSQQYKNLSSEINNGPTQLQNCKAAAGNSTLPQNVGPSVSENFIQRTPSENHYAPIDAHLSTPIGGRSPCFDIPQFAPPTLPHQLPCPPAPVASIANPSFESNQHSDNLSGPTPQQLAARHVGKKDLPVFSGDPVDWPLFYSSYQHSTQLCGFSNSENLLRLQQSLRGNTKEAVSSFLLHPSTVPEVIETLRTLFGRPEQIVHHMVNKVRSSPAPKEHRLDMLLNFGLVVQNMCSHLKAVGLENHLSDPTLLKELVDKLPPTAQFNWAMYQTQFSHVNLNDFSKYMQHVTTATSRLVMNGGISNTTSKSKGKEFVHTHAEIVDDSQQPESSQTEQLNYIGVKTCVACQKSAHPLEKCFKFQSMNIDDRWKLVKQNNKLCRRCLVAHSRWPCKGEVCGINECSKKHHRLLHFEPQVMQHATVSIHREVTSSILFRLLPVTLFGSKGHVQTFAFLDDGSSVTMLEESLANELGGDGITTSLCLQWTGGVNKNISNTRIMEFEIAGTSETRRHKLSEVYTVESLDLPEQSLYFNSMSQEYPHLQGLPVKSYECAVPRLLIGLSNAHLLMTLKAREGRQGQPVATKTRIGWSIFGRVPGKAITLPHRQLHICATKANDSLHEFVKIFFSIESLGIRAAPELQTLEDQRACKILSETTRRTPSGRFEVSLLWKYNYIEFPDSRPMAENRWNCLERRLTKNPTLYDKIRQQIVDYQLKGYAHKATQAEFERFDLRRTWFLPMGVVLNPKKPEKVRLIWDAAAKVDGVSLNSMLMKGPDLLTSLLSILFRYRERELAIAADIKEMFHQILVRPEDRSAQLFLWRDSPDKPLETMVMDVAIFGATCSPAHAQFVKNLNASEHQHDYPRAADAITRWHYVDDYIQCVDTIEEAVELALQVTEVHSRGKFEIVNWISNRNEVLEQIGANNPRAVKNMHFGEDSEGQRLLGMIWQPSSDVFSFPVQFCKEIADLVNCKTIPTKRQLLKLVMSLYDPLGLISVFTIHGKIIIQEVWRERIDWDEQIPTEIFTKWKQWLSALPDIESLKIKRCYFPGYSKNTYDHVQLHIFVDASEQAYAAVAYLRVVEGNQIRCALVSSKTKVAPLKILSIPRLELLAALIGARLRKVIEEEHTITIHEVFFWSDSTTVLSWIRSDMRRYNRFVAHRINEILELSKIEEWRWVPTRLNVADEATKWGRGPSFDAESRWYKAPEFLYELDENEWPRDRTIHAECSKEELRIESVHTHVARVPIIAFPNGNAFYERQATFIILKIVI